MSMQGKELQIERREKDIFLKWSRKEIFRAREQTWWGKEMFPDLPDPIEIIRIVKEGVDIIPRIMNWYMQRKLFLCNNQLKYQHSEEIWNNLVNALAVGSAVEIQIPLAVSNFPFLKGIISFCLYCILFFRVRCLFNAFTATLFASIALHSDLKWHWQFDK